MKFLILLIFFLIGCADQSDLQEKNDYTFLYSVTSCFYPLKHYETFDYLISEEDNITYLNKCEYDLNYRVIRENKYDFLQGTPNDDHLIGYNRYEYKDEKVIVSFHDMIQGHPNNDYWIRETTYYVE